jgi:hypothetical protein
MALRAWYVHGANWLLDDFGQRARPESWDRDRVVAVKRGLRDAALARALLRVAAWSLAGRCRASTGDQELFDAFQSDFGIETHAESRIVEFSPEGHDGDDMRLARISLESLVLASGAELRPEGYNDDLPLLVLWAGSVSTCLITSKQLVDNVIDEVGIDAAKRVLQYVTR